RGLVVHRLQANTAARNSPPVPALACLSCLDYPPEPALVARRRRSSRHTLTIRGIAETTSIRAKLHRPTPVHRAQTLRPTTRKFQTLKTSTVNMNQATPATL